MGSKGRPGIHGLYGDEGVRGPDGIDGCNGTDGQQGIPGTPGTFNDDQIINEKFNFFNYKFRYARLQRSSWRTRFARCKR